MFLKFLGSVNKVKSNCVGKLTQVNRHVYTEALNRHV